MFVVRDLIERGATPSDLRRLRSSQVKVRHGVYAPQTDDLWQQYAYRCLAVLRALKSGAVLAGPSAAVVWGLPLVGAPPREVYVRGVTRGAYSKEIHVVSGGHADITEHRGTPVVSVAWTVADCARLLSRRDGLIVTDAALHGGLCTIEELGCVAEGLKGAKAVNKFRWAVDNADPRAESPGETWMRMVVKDLGYSVTSQVVVRDGDFEARLDLLIDGSLVALEFDGLQKYEEPESEESPKSREKPKGRAPIVANEKRRQGRLESLGYACLRVIWEQLDIPRTLDRRIQTHLKGLRPRGAA